MSDELYIILSNYSDDLTKLQKRDGQLPAQAAISALNAYVLAETLKLVGEDEEYDKKIPDIFIDGENGMKMRLRQALNERFGKKDS